jgi:hypothetical protein
MVQIIAFVGTVINCVTTKFGAGLHAWNVNQAFITKNAKVLS